MRKTYIKGTNVLLLGPGYGFKDYFLEFTDTILDDGCNIDLGFF